MRKSRGGKRAVEQLNRQRLDDETLLRIREISLPKPQQRLYDLPGRRGKANAGVDLDPASRGMVLVPHSISTTEVRLGRGHRNSKPSPRSPRAGGGDSPTKSEPGTGPTSSPDKRQRRRGRSERRRRKRRGRGRRRREGSRSPSRSSRSRSGSGSRSPGARPGSRSLSPGGVSHGQVARRHLAPPHNHSTLLNVLKENHGFTDDLGGLVTEKQKRSLYMHPGALGAPIPEDAALVEGSRSPPPTALPQISRQGGLKTLRPKTVGFSDAPPDVREFDARQPGLRPWTEHQSASEAFDRGWPASGSRGDVGSVSRGSVTSSVDTLVSGWTDASHSELGDTQRTGKIKHSRGVRVRDDSMWAHDSFGYLWARGADEQTVQDRLALRGDDRNRVNRRQKYRQLSSAYSGTMGGMDMPVLRKAPASRSAKRRAQRRRRLGGGTAGDAAAPLPMKDAAMRFDLSASADFPDPIQQQRHVTLQHEVDLGREEEQTRKDEAAAHKLILAEIERQKGLLPMGFLMQWGLGAFTMNKSVNLMVRVLTRLINSSLVKAWNSWRNLVWSQQAAEHSMKMEEFRKFMALNTINRILRAYVRGKTARSFDRWVQHTVKHRRVEWRRRRLNAAVTIQNAYRGMKSRELRRKKWNALCKKKAKERAQLTAILKHERRIAALRWRHLRNKRCAEFEHRAACTMQRNWRCAHGNQLLNLRMVATRKRKEKEAAEALERAARKVQMAWRRSQGRFALHLKFMARRQILEEEARRQLALLAQQRAVEDLEMAARRVQLSWRKAQGKYMLHLKFLARRELLDEEEREREREREREYQRQLEVAARRVQLAWHKAQGRYILNLKFMARKQILEEEAYQRRLEAAARRVQLSWRKAQGKYILHLKFLARKQILEEERELERMNMAALRLQAAWHRSQGNFALHLKFQARKQAMEEAEYQKRLLAAARRVQLSWRKSKGRYILHLKFMARKELLAEEEYQRRLELAARRVQLSWRKAQGKYILHLKFLARKERMEQEEYERRLEAAALRVQASWRKSNGRYLLHLKFKARKEKLEEERERARQNAAATLIGGAWRRANERYNLPIRVMARMQIERKRLMALHAEHMEELNQAARKVQVAWRRRQGNFAMHLKFMARKQRMEEIEYENQLDLAARRVQLAWRKSQGNYAMTLKFAARRQRMEDDAYEAELNDAAKRLQHAWRRSHGRYAMQLKFAARRQIMEEQLALEDAVATAKADAAEALKMKEAAEEAHRKLVLSGWKRGADQFGVNYFYNWVTGESRWDKPEGWEPAKNEVWVKNSDERGNTYYYNQDTGKTSWLPPCFICGDIAERICVECNEAFCRDDFDAYHKEEDLEHTWKGADQDKAEIARGDKHCIECGRRQATVFCTVCRDPYCDECFPFIHHTGALAKHRTIPMDEAKQGWQVVKGRVEGEATYYFNVTTGENTYDKPEDIMQDAERSEHQKFKKYEAANATAIKKVEKLQVQLESLRYEKDKMWFDTQTASAAEHEELEALRKAIADKPLEKSRARREAMKHPIRYMRQRRKEQKRQALLYKRKLFLSQKQRKDMGLALRPNRFTPEDPNAEEAEGNSSSPKKKAKK